MVKSRPHASCVWYTVYYIPYTVHAARHNTLSWSIRGKDTTTILMILVHARGNERLLVKHALLPTTMVNLPPHWSCMHNEYCTHAFEDLLGQATDVLHVLHQWTYLVIHSPPIINLQQVINSLDLPVRSVRNEIGHGSWNSISRSVTQAEIMRGLQFLEANWNKAVNATEGSNNVCSCIKFYKDKRLKDATCGMLLIGTQIIVKNSNVTEKNSK